MGSLRDVFTGPFGVLTRGRWKFGVREAAVVAVAAIVAIGGQGLLTPWLAGELPFVTTFPTVAIVAFFIGITAGVVTAVVCLLWILSPLPPQSIPEIGLQSAMVFLPASFLVAFFSGQGRDVATASDPVSTNSTLRTLKVSMFMAAALPTVLFLGTAWITYGQAIDDARLRVERETRIAQEHADKVMENSEAIVRSVLEMLRPFTPEEIVVRERELHLMLADMSRLAQVEAITVSNSAGRVIASSRDFPTRGIDVSERISFRSHQDARSGAHVSELASSRVGNDTVFELSRRWEHAGKFAGVVSVSLRPAYFADFYRGMALDEPGLAVMLVRPDGEIIAHWPQAHADTLRIEPGSALALAMAGGEVQGRLDDAAAVAGEERVGSFRRLDDHPLYLVAGIDHDQIITGWQRRLALLAAFTFPISIALVYTAFVAFRRTQLEVATQQQLQREIEQRAQVEAALRHVQKLEALGRLTGGVAHDFNNLLAVINNNLHLIERLEPTLQDSKQLAAIGRAVASGERLTRQLLTFARRQPVQPQVISLQERLPILLGLIAPTLGASIETSMEVEADARPVLVDAAELELAVINLAVNAKDAMRDGGRLTLSARNAMRGEIDIPGAFVVITVADTGTGIAPELSERVFEPFFTTKPPGQGTGLGLSQVYGLCAQAGGTARVQSALGKGPQVQLFLPAADDANAGRAAGPDKTFDPLECSILLVEDNADIAMTTQQLLQTFGCSVTWVASGDAARTAVDSDPTRYNLVISDMAMPGELDGLALAEYLRKRHPQIKLMLITGYTNQLQEASARRFTVLAKPCSPDSLIKAMRELLGKAATPEAAQL